MGKHAEVKLRRYVLHFGDGQTLEMSRQHDSDIVRDVRVYNATWLDGVEPYPPEHKIVRITLKEGGSEVWNVLD
jgi:uncharacterized protein (UPF0248 family)